MSKPQSHHLSIPSKSPAPPHKVDDDDDDSEPEEEDDENDPFADRNAVITPRVERSEPNWT